MARRRRSPLRRLRKRMKAMGRGAQNAAMLMRRGRLGAPYQAPYTVELEDEIFRLRRYNLGPDDDGARRVPQPLLFVPPLMLTSEIYDISPELSAAVALMAQGVDVWLVDFGAPEHQPGAMRRTLEQHVLAVDRAVTAVRERAGADVHLAGYSQGGMFCYQVAAFRRCDGVASIVTFGSPVDVWRNLPLPIHDQLVEQAAELGGGAVGRLLRRVPSVPGVLTSTGFKVLNPTNELKQFSSFFGILHDREALVAQEPKRRYLRGKGFVAWPGPAFREFVDEVVIHNRMTSGGLVIGDRSVGLADLTCPILLFVGHRDDLARPRSVRAIHKVAPAADIHEVALDAGHFGLVVGGRAMEFTWPTVGGWTAWLAGLQEPPAILENGAGAELADAPARESEGDGVPRADALYDHAVELLDRSWHKLGDVSLDATALVETMRWQLPRLAKLEDLMRDTAASPSTALAEQAETIPDEPFFLWKGRAFTYAEADGRVNQGVRALRANGVEVGQPVGVLMDPHPATLNTALALNRMGAVVVMLDPARTGEALQRQLACGEVEHLVVDGAHADAALAAFDGPVLLFGRPTSDLEQLRDTGGLPHRFVDGNPTIVGADDGPVTGLPRVMTREPALLLFTPGLDGTAQAARLTNRRWVATALGAATAGRLTSHDTVYCALPLHTAGGLMVAVGGALVGGARLALAPSFSVEGFRTDVHRVGATVVHYDGAMGRALVDAPPAPGDRKHALRLFAGSGLDADAWRRLHKRFGRVQVLEYYLPVAGNVALVNLTGEKAGSVGRPLGRARDLALLVEGEDGAFVRRPDGKLQACRADVPGVLISRIRGRSSSSWFVRFTDPDENEARALRGVFSSSDRWYCTGDRMVRDEDGDYWRV